ncbi:NADH dehydrogenase [uncultured archaeon]|nr:NADH dehydrogenase [uncultured archaeon]
MNAFVQYSVLNVLFAVLVSPLFMSLIKKVKALAQGRKGPSLFQMYYNLWKLLKKEVIYSSNSSWIMRVTPYVNITVMAVAALFVPLILIPQPVYGIGNIILFLYLLSLAKFFMALSGLDAGSAFGGMGSSREMTISALIETITIVVFAALAFALKTTNLHEMFLQILESNMLFLNPVLILISISVFIVLIVETARVPVDNPETHLELTMIHEAMILEQSGKNLALMEWSHAIKQLLFMGILINILFPWGIAVALTQYSIVVSMLAFLVKASVLAVAVGLFESSCAKSRLFHLPSLFTIALFFSVITILIEVFA